VVRGPWGIGLLGGLLVGVATIALIPSRVNLAEAESHARDPRVVLAALETLHMQRPSMASAKRLAVAYGKNGEQARAIRVLQEAGGDLPLPASERRLVRRLALAARNPGLALPSFARAARAGDPQAHKEFTELALWARRPELALAGERAWLARQPMDRQTLVRVRDLALATGHRAEAIACQRQIVQLDDGPDALQRLVSLHLAGNDPWGALCDMVRIHPPNTVALHDQAARLANWAGKHAEAREYAWAAYLLAPDATRAQAILAGLGTDRSPKMVARVLRLAADAPGDRTFRKSLREWLRARKQAQVAGQLLDEDVARYPDDYRLHQEKLTTLLAHRALDGAIVELTRYLGVRPGNRAVQLKLAQVLAFRGQTAAAWQRYAAVLGTDTRATLAERQAWLAVSGPADDWHPAGLGNLEALVRLSPQSADYRRRLARAHADAGNHSAAIAHQRQLLRSAQATAQDRITLVRWLMWENKLAEATQRVIAIRTPVPEDILKTLAQRAASRENWDDCSTLLTALIRQRPQDSLAHELLALALEARGELAQAASVWQRRLQLGKADSDRWLLAAGLFSRSDRPEQALALLRAMPEVPTPAVWRTRGFLAFKLAHFEEAVEAFEHVRKQTPGDADLLLTLALANDKCDRLVAAQQLREDALALRPNDLDLLTTVAAFYVYGAHPEQGAAYVTRLVEANPREVQAIRVVADFYQARDSAAARRWLDELHHASSGDAQTWFRRAGLEDGPEGAFAVQAYAKAVTLAEQSQSRLDREAGAWSLERLDRMADAEKTWRQIALDFPQDATAFARLARFHLARGELEGADVPLAVLERLEPTSPDTLILMADRLKQGKRAAEAADLLAQVPDDDSQIAYVKAAEAMARHAAGQFAAARGVAKRNLTERPGSNDAGEAYRLVREDAGWALKFDGQIEQYAGLDRQQMAVQAWNHLNDTIRVETRLQHAQWASGTVRTEQGEVALQVHRGAWRLEARSALARLARDQAGTSLSPAVSVLAGWQAEGLQVSLDAQDQRWEELNGTMQLGGRERSVAASARWQARDTVTVGARGAIGQLSVPNGVNGDSTALVTDLRVRISPTSPLTIYHEFRHRGWGDAGGALNLPKQLNVQTLSVSLTERLGMAQVEIQPGMAYDHSAQTFGATAAGSVSWDLTPDTSLAVYVNWGSRALNIGAAGDYLQSQVTLACRL